VVIALHTAVGVVALLSGAANLLARKGTRRHRRVGRLYTLAMYVLVLSSFGITQIFDGFGAFHVLAVVSGITLTIALYFPLRRHRHPSWLDQHYFWIGYSYVGLVMATGSHLFEVFPRLPFALGAMLFWGVPYVVGSAIIFKRRRSAIARLPPTFTHAKPTAMNLWSRTPSPRDAP
jgi:uncharacterized membrane protein